jgi:hypothetical protein
MLLVEAHLLLVSTSTATRTLFWEDLSKDLEVISRDSTRISEEPLAADVISAAQDEVTRFRGSSSGAG